MIRLRRWRMRKQRRDRRIRGRKKQRKNIPNEKTKKENKEKKKQKTNQRKEKQIKKLTLIKWEGRFAALMALVWFSWRWSGSCRRFYTIITKGGWWFVQKTYFSF